jgi:L1 cell adhesion molecule
VRCVEKCPSSHYFDAKSNVCLPCHESCFGCTGPKDTIEPGGCTKCASALVQNDDDYTIVKCILRETYECNNNYFLDLVPPNLKSHPLVGKTVCRECNNECDNCYQNGAHLNTECEKCKNYYSKASNKCVSNCSLNNEYEEPGTKVNTFGI